MLVLLYAEAAEQARGVALCIPPFEFGELLLKLRGAYAVGIAEVGLGIQGILLLHDVPKHGVTLEHCVHHSEFIKFEVILFEHTHAFARALGYSAVGGTELSAQHTHQCGFAGTVGADNAVAVARSEFHVHILKQHSFSKLYA